MMETVLLILMLVVGLLALVSVIGQIAIGIRNTRARKRWVKAATENTRRLTGKDSL